MRFPSLLKCSKCIELPENKIHPQNLMYARHPLSHWSEEQDYPDFTKIRSNQSFNWSAFSIPIWARFNDKKVYQSKHGVMGYSVNTIRNAHYYKPHLPKNQFGLKHDPLKYNYSHCVLYPRNTGNKAKKREFRHTLINNSKRKILPNKKVSLWCNFIEFFRMIIHRLLVFFR